MPAAFLNLADVAWRSDDFRRVLLTTAHSQFVSMSIPPGGEIGEERHRAIEQTFICLGGAGEIVVDGEAAFVDPEDVVVVPPRSRHNVRNAADVPLRLLTIYVPPVHIDGRVHRTKADADEDDEDAEFGRRADR